MVRNIDKRFNEIKTFNIQNPIKKSKFGGMFEGTYTSIDKYKSNLYTLLFTSQGDRPMLPEFGLKGILIGKILFEPITNNTYSNVDRIIISHVNKWIPEIVIDEVEFKNKEEAKEDGLINIVINFHLKLDPEIQDFIEAEMSV